MKLEEMNVLRTQFRGRKEGRKELRKGGRKVWMNRKRVKAAERPKK